MKVNKPLRLAWYGNPKIGKSHLAAQFVKDFDGIYMDFARVNIISAPKVKNGPKSEYTVKTGMMNTGDAYTAAENVGLNPSQYQYVESWDQFEMLVDYAINYRDNISKKPNKRIWVVIDDTTNFRYQALQKVLQKTDHESPSRPDWTMTNMVLVSMFNRLERNFNSIYVNQRKEEYVRDEPTGNYVGEFYPKNLEFIVDATIFYTEGVDELDIKYPKFEVKSLRNKWRFSTDDSYKKVLEFKDVKTLQPSTILEALHIEKDMW